MVDGCAFRIYHHWVKHGDVQNRAALFENRPKMDLLRNSSQDEKLLHNLQCY